MKFTHEKGDGEKKEHKHEGVDDYITFGEENGNKPVDVDNEWLFAQESESCQIEVTFVDYNDDKHFTENIDCTTTDDGKTTIKFEKNSYEVEYTVKTLAKPTRFFKLMYIWDVTAPYENDGDELALQQSLTFKGNKYTWTVPKDDHLSAGRTSVIAF